MIFGIAKVDITPSSYIRNRRASIIMSGSLVILAPGSTETGRRDVSSKRSETAQRTVWGKHND